MVLKPVKHADMFASEPISKAGLKPSIRQINLLRGWPSTQLLPARSVLHGATHVLSLPEGDPPASNTRVNPEHNPSPPIDYDSLSLSEKALLYGPDPGHGPLRVALAKWLQQFYGPATRRAYPSAFKSTAYACSTPSEYENYTIPYSRIALTGGASQSLGVMLNTLTDPTYTRKVWIVAPAYFLAFHIFQDAGFAGSGRLVAVPELTYGKEDETRADVSRGPDVSWLRTELEKCELDWEKQGGATEPQLKPYPVYKKIYKHVIYTVPSFSNPSSITSSLDVREKLVKCARDFDALVICDDVYDMLQWPAGTKDSDLDNSRSKLSVGHEMNVAPLPRLVDIDRYLERRKDQSSSNNAQYGNVVSNGTFSKIVGPGCRVGWVEGSPDLAFAISQAGTTKSGGSAGHLVSTFLCQLLEDGTLQEHLSKVLRPAYELRWRTLIEATHEHLVPLGVRMPYPHGASTQTHVQTGTDLQSDPPRAGGYFVWLTLPKGISAAELSRRCLDEENLVVAGGNLFQVPRNAQDENHFEENVRLCFAWEALPELQQGILRLARVLKAMLARSPETSAPANRPSEQVNMLEFG